MEGGAHKPRSTAGGSQRKARRTARNRSSLLQRGPGPAGAPPMSDFWAPERRETKFLFEALGHSSRKTLTQPLRSLLWPDTSLQKEGRGWSGPALRSGLRWAASSQNRAPAGYGAARSQAEPPVAISAPPKRRLNATSEPRHGRAIRSHARPGSLAPPPQGPPAVLPREAPSDHSPLYSRGARPLDQAIPR